jgi:hypothetical protein
MDRFILPPTYDNTDAGDGACIVSPSGGRGLLEPKKPGFWKKPGFSKMSGWLPDWF